MNLSFEAIESLKSHWTFSNICKAEQNDIVGLTSEKLAQSTVGEQFNFKFTQKRSAEKILEQANISYDYAVIEGLMELCRKNGDRKLVEQAVAASYLAYDIQSLEDIPEDIDEKFNFVLKIAALAYFGDRSADLRRWLKENQHEILVESIHGMPWDRKLKFRIFECWIRLFRKDGWKDLHRISEIVSQLRENQNSSESEYLNAGDEQANSARAVKLAALYNLARATELVAEFHLNGRITVLDSSYSDPIPSLEKHFDAAVAAADMIGEVQFALIFRYLYATARIMIYNSLWSVARRFNSKTSELIESLTKRENHPMYELLPPQKSAILEHGLLDPAKTAIVVDMPTSGGKTLLAEFRILQALNQFQNEKGWVAYVVPTRALAAQITRRLRQDLEPIGISIEQLTAAVEVDAFEEKLLSENQKPFDILIATPEKLSLLIKNNRVENRPLALAVIDEAHNLESDGRGMRLEFLLAVIKRDCPNTNFLLMLPNAGEIDPLIGWLSALPDSGLSISLGTTPWKPNDRIIGMYRAVADTGSNWHLEFEPLTTSKNSLPLKGKHQIGSLKPIDVPKSRVLSKGNQKGTSLQTAAIAKEMHSKGTSIAVGRSIPLVWSMASSLCRELPKLDRIPKEIELLQEYLRVEFGPNFQLVETLERGVGVHHAGLSDDVRTLVEWLAETGSLRVLCATTTIAQGLNFPVASVFLQSYKFSYGVEMTPREFWNLAGRAGRIGQDSVGIVGIAAGDNQDGIKDFINRSTDSLVSQLVVQMNKLEELEDQEIFSAVFNQDQWEDFRCYIAHLLAQKKSLDAALSDMEHFLMQTYGYATLRNSKSQSHKANALMKASREYAKRIANWKGVAELSDSTGFSPEGVVGTMGSIQEIHPKLKREDWNSEILFSNNGKLPELYNVMLNVPQLKRHLEKIGSSGYKNTRLSEITLDWINGNRIEKIANDHFSETQKDGADSTSAITSACQAIFGTIVNCGSWGISALSQCSGLNFDEMKDSERHRISLLPAMIYHGVNSEEAVLMRMNSVPRSSAMKLGKMFEAGMKGRASDYSVANARKFLKSLGDEDWQKACPSDFKLNGTGFKRIWQVLAGEAI